VNMLRILLESPNSVELVHNMEEYARYKIELRKKLKQDNDTWNQVRTPFRQSEAIRWKIHELIMKGLSDGWFQPCSSVKNVDKYPVYFRAVPPYFCTFPTVESYLPDISKINWLNEFDRPASSTIEWAYIKCETVFDTPNPERFVYLKDPDDKLDPVITAAGKFDLTQILAAHELIQVDDYSLWMPQCEDDEWIIVRHKRRPGTNYGYDIIETRKGEGVLIRVVKENLGTLKEVRAVR